MRKSKPPRSTLAIPPTLPILPKLLPPFLTPSLTLCIIDPLGLGGLFLGVPLSGIPAGPVGVGLLGTGATIEEPPSFFLSS